MMKRVQPPKNIIRELAPGLRMPLIGFGCYMIPQTPQGKASLASAIELGYRHFDTAQFYENEALLGQVIRESGIPREEFFIVSKLWFSNARYEQARIATRQSLDKLGLGYLDLMLIHWPGNGVYASSDPRNRQIRRESWAALEEFVGTGQIKGLGVSNYLPRHLQEIEEYSQTPVTCNQFELHPLYQDEQTIKYCQKKNIQIVSYSSLMRNDQRLIEDPVVNKIADSHAKTPGEVVLRWALSHDYAVIPKSIEPVRQERNLGVLDFDLSEEEVQALDELNTMTKLNWDPQGVA